MHPCDGISHIATEEIPHSRDSLADVVGGVGTTWIILDVNLAELGNSRVQMVRPE
jgi:hypothetical protein